MTCLDQDIDWDVLPTLVGLKDTISHLPGEQLRNTTPSPIKMEVTTRTKQTRRKQNGVFSVKERRIVRSSKCIPHDRLVSSFVIIILNALKGNFKRNSYEKFSKGDCIKVNCIKMDTGTYQYGKLTTTYNGLHQKLTLDGSRRRSPSKDKTLYLLRCIGTGSTSKAYQAITKDGYSCVIKMYVQRFDIDGTMKVLEQFKKESNEHVTKEINYYKKIYKDELKDYVWRQTLNEMDCIILPMFHPVPVSKRSGVIPDITDRLKLFTKHKLAFLESDQSWRHIGRFNGKLYLFDLGDLEICESEKAATLCASNHVNWLTDTKSSESTSSAEFTDSSSQYRHSI